jgi:transposase
VCRKKPELWENQTCTLHHNNALVHALLLVLSYLAKHKISILPHPPYSPNFAQVDFFLFPKLKTTLKGRRFQTIEEIQENMIRELRTITESALQEAFHQWKRLGKVYPQ